MASSYDETQQASSLTSSEDLGFVGVDANAESSQEDNGSPSISRGARERNYPPALQISKLLDGDSGVDIPCESSYHPICA